MYCKNCHTLVPDGEVICLECGYDNSQELNVLEETQEIHLNSKGTKKGEKKTRIKNTFIVLAIILVIGLVSFYIISDSKSFDDSKQKNDNVSEETKLNYDTEFTLEKLKINYPSNSFGASKSTIFYKNNNAYNIEVKTITLDEYNKLIEKTEYNESSIGGIITKAYAEDNKYCHVFTDDINYYIIIVNFVSDGTLESTKIQLELAQILNSSYIFQEYGDD